MSRKPSSLDGKPLMVALSVLTVAVAGSVREVGAQTLNCAQGIEYGTLAACGVANTMTVEPDGGFTTSGCLTPIGNALPGACILTGIVGTTVITAVGPGNLNNGGTGNMVIDGFLMQVTGSPTAVTVINVTPSMNNLNFGVGATLHVGAAQAAGTYTGTYTINTNYP